MSDEHVLLEHDDHGVATITLNRPERLNALTYPMLDRLRDLGRMLATDDSVRCVVLTGAGRGFSAGGDVKAMNDGSMGAAGRTGGNALSRAEELRDRMEISRLLFEMPKPTIAAVNGVAAGAGLSIALAADMRIASDQARFGTAFVRVALSGDYGGSWLLQRLVGPAKARELYMTGEIIDAQEALRLGMVNRVVPADGFAEVTTAMARQLAAGPPLTLARIKQNFARGATMTLSEALDLEAHNHTYTGTTEDHKEAAAAFVEKREPVFRGT